MDSKENLVYLKLEQHLNNYSVNELKCLPLSTKKMFREKPHFLYPPMEIANVKTVSFTHTGV